MSSVTDHSCWETHLRPGAQQSWQIFMWAGTKGGRYRCALGAETWGHSLEWVLLNTSSSTWWGDLAASNRTREQHAALVPTAVFRLIWSTISKGRRRYRCCQTCTRGCRVHPVVILMQHLLPSRLLLQSNELCSSNFLLSMHVTENAVKCLIPERCLPV